MADGLRATLAPRTFAISARASTRLRSELKAEIVETMQLVARTVALQGGTFWSSLRIPRTTPPTRSGGPANWDYSFPAEIWTEVIPAQPGYGVPQRKPMRGKKVTGDFRSQASACVISPDAIEVKNTQAEACATEIFC